MMSATILNSVLFIWIPILNSIYFCLRHELYFFKNSDCKFNIVSWMISKFYSKIIRPCFKKTKQTKKHIKAVLYFLAVKNFWRGKIELLSRVGVHCAVGCFNLPKVWKYIFFVMIPILYVKIIRKMLKIAILGNVLRSRIPSEV